MFRIFGIFRRAAEMEGKLAVAQSEVLDLKARILDLEAERRTFMDWLLWVNGAPSMFQPETKPDKTKLNGASRPRADIGTARNARDFQNLAEAALNAPIPEFQRPAREN